MSTPNVDASTRGNITDTELVDTIFDVILNDSHVTGNESETFEDIEWEEGDDEYGRTHVDFYMLSVLFPAVLFGVVINALFLGLLIKSRLMKQYQVCAFLIAISVNNILDLLFQYGFHWIFLLERSHYHQLTSTDFTCRLGNFLWTFFLSAQYLVMTGFTVNRLLEQQLYEVPASTSSSSGGGGCCSLPRNSIWKAIASKFCSPLGTLVYLIIATVVLVIANVPNFWIYSVEYGWCAIDTSIWGYDTSYTWYVASVTFFWMIFFVSYLVVTPLTICGSGPRPVAYFQTMFGYSAMEEETEEADQSGNFTRLSIITSTVIWVIAVPVCSIRFSEYLTYSLSHQFYNALHNVLDVIRTFHCLYLALWPLTCLILVPALRVEAKRICAVFQQWCTCCREQDGGIVVQMTNVADGD